MVDLPRLRQTDPAFMKRAWDELCKQIEASLNGINAALEAAGIAQEAADNANAAAAAAQAAADNTTSATALANSTVTGLTITATDAGSDASIDIGAHTRVYGDSTTAAVSGGTITGLAYSTAYWVYYDAPKGTTGAVTYQAATTIQGNATGNANRHFVGAINTPAALDPDTDGIPVIPPGGVIP